MGGGGAGGWSGVGGYYDLFRDTGLPAALPHRTGTCTPHILECGLVRRMICMESSRRSWLDQGRQGVLCSAHDTWRAATMTLCSCSADQVPYIPGLWEGGDTRWKRKKKKGCPRSRACRELLCPCRFYDSLVQFRFGKFESKVQSWLWSLILGNYVHRFCQFCCLFEGLS